VSQLRLSTIVAIAALAAPAAAAAHPRGPTIALDERATVDAVTAAGVRAAILDGDRKLRLTVSPGVRLVVLGYLGEPMLRLSAERVSVNGRSPTALADGLVKAPPPRGWVVVGTGPSFAWHDHRLGPTLPPGVSRARWSIPIVVNGHRSVLGGELERMRKPALWPWLALGTVLLGFGAAVAFARRLELSVATGIGVGVLAGAGGLSSLAGFSLAAVGVERGRVELAAAAVLAAAAAAGLVLGGRRRLAVAGAIGALALIEGLGRLGVFVHGVVISDLPAAAARAADTVAIGAGLAAILIALTQPYRGPTPAKRRTTRGR
jgi:hypothetical protein